MVSHDHIVRDYIGKLLIECEWPKQLFSFMLVIQRGSFLSVFLSFFLVFLFSSFSSTVLFNIFIYFLINFFSFFCWIRYFFSFIQNFFRCLLGDECTDAHLHRLASALQVLSVCFSFRLLLCYVVFLFFFLFSIMFCFEQRSDVLDVTEQQQCFGKTVWSWTVVIHFDTFHTFSQMIKPY